MQAEDIIGGWLSGETNVGGHSNPAGSLYTEGQAKMEAAMTNADLGLFTRCSGCTASFPTHCC